MRIAYLLLALSLAAPAHAETTKFNPFTGKLDYIGLTENGDGSHLTGVLKPGDAATPAQGVKADSALQPTGSGAGLTGITPGQIGLGNVDNTTDSAKPVSTATQAALDGKALNAQKASNAMAGLMASLSSGQSAAIQVIGDSTGNGTDEWVYLVTQWLAARNTTHNVRYYLWNDTTQAYDQSVLQTGPQGARYASFAGGGMGMIQPASDIAPLTGSAEFRAQILPSSWRPASNQTILSHFDSAGNRSFRWQIMSDGRFYYDWTSDGSTLNSVYSSAALTDTGGTAQWVRLTHNTASHSVTFYTSSDGVTWNQLGTAQNTATGTLFNASANWEIGSRGGSGEPYSGKIYSVEIRQGIGGPTINPLNIDAWQPLNTTSTFGGSPDLYVVNGSHPGADITYWSDANRKTYGMPNYSPALVFVSLSHNEGKSAGFTEFGRYNTFLGLVNAAYPKSGVVFLTQNPQIAPGPYVRGQSVRRGQILAQYPTIDTQGAFLKDSRGLSALINSDGVHPNSDGSLLWASTVESALLSSESTGIKGAAPSTTGTSLLKGDGSGGTVAAVAGTDYLPATATAINNVSIGSANSWAQLGTTITGAGTTSIFNTVSPLMAASRGTPTFTGRYYGMTLRSGIDGAALVKLTPSEWTSGMTWTDSLSGKLWTMSTGCPSPILAGVDSYFDLTTAAGNQISTPDVSAYATTDLQAEFDVAPADWTPSAATVLGGQTGGGGDRGWWLELGTNGKLYLTWSPDGTTLVTATSTIAVPATDGTRLLVKVVLDVNNGSGGYDVKFFTRPAAASTLTFSVVSGKTFTAANSITLAGADGSTLHVGDSAANAGFNSDLLDGQHGNYYAPLLSPSFTTPSLGVATATSINGTTIPTSATLVTTASGLATDSNKLNGQLASYYAPVSSPSLVTPALGVATATSINKVAITQPATSATLTVADGKTLTASNSLTLAGTDGTTMTFPASSSTIPAAIASGTAALGTSAIASGTCATAVTATATGVATTDVVDWGFNGDPTAATGYQASTSGMLTIIAYPTTNSANFKVCNNTASSITPGAVTLNWRVRR